MSESRGVPAALVVSWRDEGRSARHAGAMSDTAKPTEPTEPERVRAEDVASDDEVAPAEELRRALDHLGRAALSFRDRYLSDEQVQAAGEKARVGAEQLAEDAERALRKAGGSLDTFAEGAEQSVGRVAEEAERALREAQQAAVPKLRAGLARLSSLLEGKREPLPEEPPESPRTPDDRDPD